MTDEPDGPNRLLEDLALPADLRGGLAELRSRRPTEAQLAALSAGLGIPIEGGDVGTASPGDVTTGVATGAGKFVVGAVAAVTGAVLLWLARPSVPEGDAIQPGSGAPHADRPSPGAAEAARAASPPARVAAGHVGREQPMATSVSLGPEAPDRPTPQAPAADTPERDATELPRHGEGDRAPRPAIPVRSPHGTGARGSGAADRPSEMELLREARAFLPVDPGEALAFTERHRTEFPGGALSQEREMLAITALVKLRRSDEAVERVREFRRRYPGSAYLPRLERLVPAR